MIILITSFTFPPFFNGVANVAFEQARGLSERGHDVTVFTSVQDLSPDPDFKKFKVVRFDVRGNANIRSRYCGEVDRYIDAVANFECDIICCNCWQIWSTDLAVRVFHRVKARKVLVSHGVSATVRHHGVKGLLNWLLWQPYLLYTMPKILKFFDHIIFLCDKSDKVRFYDRMLVENLQSPSFSVIPNGVDMSRFESSKFNFRAENNLQNKVIILCVGDYTNLKNVKDAMRAYVKANIKNSVFVSIGNCYNRYTFELNELWSNIKNNDIEYICLWSLSQDYISSIYQEADIFLCTSTTEYFPLVILEAMASKTPFVSFNVGCVDELPGGIVVRDVDEMASALSRVVASPELKQSLIDSGYASSVNRYSWLKVIDQYEMVFNLILQNN